MVVTGFFVGTVQNFVLAECIICVNHQNISLKYFFRQVLKTRRKLEIKTILFVIVWKLNYISLIILRLNLDNYKMCSFKDKSLPLNELMMKSRNFMSN